MPSTEFEPLGRVRIGEILSRSFRLARLNWRWLAILSILLLWAPQEILLFVGRDISVYRDLARFTNSKLFQSISFFAVAICGGYFGVVTLRTIFDRMDGKLGRFGHTLAAGARVLPASALIMVLVNTPSFLLMITIGAPRTYAVYSLFALSAMLTNTIWSVFVGATIAVVLEERGSLTRAFARAASLSRGQRLRLLPIMLIYQCAYFGGLMAIAMTGAGLIGANVAHLEYAWIAVVEVPAVASSAVIYRELRRIKDGLTRDELSVVFG